MDRSSSHPVPVAPPAEVPKDLNRDHWEKVAEEAISRAFREASAGLPLPGIDGRSPAPAGREEESNTPSGKANERAGGRQGFRLTLTDNGTSFTTSIGACFHFRSLRHLIGASGRTLGLKAVIVVQGQVVLLPESVSPWRSPLKGASARSTDQTYRLTVEPIPGTTPAPQAAVPWLAARAPSSLLGLAQLVPHPPPGSTAVWESPHSLPLCPLWPR